LFDKEVVMRSVVVFVVAVATVAASPVQAQFKCTGADGRATYQDRPCTHDQAQSTVKIVVPRMRPVQAAPNPRVAGPVETDPLTEVYRRWIDADALAASTARIALAGPVERLQALAREVAGMRVHSCAERARAALAKVTAVSSNGMLQFMLKKELQTMVARDVELPRLVYDFEWQVESANCPSVKPGQAAQKQP